MGLADVVNGHGWEGSADDLEERMRDFYPGVMGLAYGDANRLLPVDVAFDISNPAVKKTIRQLAKKVRAVTETTREEIRAIIDRGTEQGLSVADMAKQIRERGEIASKTRSLTIARSESAVAYSTGSVLAYREAGVTKVEVLDGDDDEECAEANGQIWTLEEAMERPTGHPNCLVGDTQVVAPYRLRRSTFTRWFDGEVVTIRTSANDNLTCTPNHPILTTRGWVVAGLLNEGDYAIQALDSQRIAALLDPNDYHMPTSIEEIARAALMPGSVTTRTMPVTAEDFHSDGIGSDVYVESTNSKLGGGLDTMPMQELEQFNLTGAIEVAAQLATLSAFDKLLMGHVASSPGFVGFDSDGVAYIRRHTFVEDVLGLRGGTAEAGSLEPMPHSGGVGVKHRANVGRGEALGNVQVIEDVGVGALLNTSAIPQGVPHFAELAVESGRANTDAKSKLVTALAGLIAPIQVVNVERRQFAGHVYNLHTVQGWYIANDIITHNCTRAFVPVVE